MSSDDEEWRPGAAPHKRLKTGASSTPRAAALSASAASSTITPTDRDAQLRSMLLSSMMFSRGQGGLPFFNIVSMSSVRSNRMKNAKQNRAAEAAEWKSKESERPYRLSDVADYSDREKSQAARAYFTKLKHGDLQKEAHMHGIPFGGAKYKVLERLFVKAPQLRVQEHVQMRVQAEATTKATAAAGKGSEDKHNNDKDNGSRFVGSRVRKHFGEEHGWCSGKVTAFDDGKGGDDDGLQLWTVVYDDGDTEDLELDELKEVLLPTEAPKNDEGSSRSTTTANSTSKAKAAKAEKAAVRAAALARLQGYEDAANERGEKRVEHIRRSLAGDLKAQFVYDKRLKKGNRMLKATFFNAAPCTFAQLFANAKNSRGTVKTTNVSISESDLGMPLGGMCKTLRYGAMLSLVPGSMKAKMEGSQVRTITVTAKMHMDK